MRRGFRRTPANHTILERMDFWICGKLLLRLLPKTGRPICISIGMVVRGYWFLLMETFAATRRPPLHHYIVAPRGPYRGDNVKYSNATHLPSLCLSGLFPLSDPWYSSSSPSHRPSTSRYSAYYNVPLSRTHTTSVLCRWLAGDNQKLLIPYFIRSTSSIHTHFTPFDFYSLVFPYSLIWSYHK